MKKLIFTGLIALSGVANAQPWLTVGNSTLPGDYLGTNNGNDLVIKTNGLEQARITSTGNTAFGNYTSPLSTIKFEVKSMLTAAASGTTYNGISSALWHTNNQTSAFEMRSLQGTVGAGNCNQGTLYGVWGKAENGNTNTGGYFTGLSGNCVGGTPNNYGIQALAQDATINTGGKFSALGATGQKIGVDINVTTNNLTTDWGIRSNGNAKITSSTLEPSLYLENTASGGKNWSIQSRTNGYFVLKNQTGSLDVLNAASTGEVSIGASSTLLGAKLYVLGTGYGIRGDAVNSTAAYAVTGIATGSGGAAQQVIGVTGTGSGSQQNFGGYFTGVANASASGGTFGMYARVLNPTFGTSCYGVYSTVGGSSNSGGTGPKYAGFFDGDVVTAQGSYMYSDRRIKKDILTIQNSIDIIKKLNPVTYNFDRQTNPDLGLSAEKQYGFISQEIQEILPEFTKNVINPAKTDETGKEIYPKKEILGLNYNGFIALLTKGMQEQQQTIETLQEQVKEQKQLISDLQTKSGLTTGLNNIDGTEVGFEMDQNIPNPFSNETKINYTLSEQTKTAILNVYDLSGKQVTSFPLTEKGSSSITIASEKLAAGIYIYSIVADGKIMDSKRMVVAEK